jgi:signal transduction histidine kinase
MKNYEIVVSDETSSLLQAIAEAEDDPVFIAELAQIDPAEFREFISECGEAENREAKQLLKAAESLKRPTVGITARKQSGQRLQSAPNELGRRVQERTKRKIFEEQLIQSQKLEAVGRLAGGVAHDFNNLLTAIIGYSQLSLGGLQADNPLRRNLEEIRKAGERAAALTRQLLAFSRQQVMQTKVIDLNTVIAELERMLGRMLGEDIELRTTLREGLGSVKADPGQLEQVIMNLVVNARDAMPSGGKVTIETANVYLGETYAVQHPGAYVMLAVSDTGAGIDEETQKRVFEPFFTTEKVGKGTGLGLSTVYGIVKQSGGNIWVYSEPGKGTTFSTYLPRVDESAEEYKRPEPLVDPPHGTETVLLLEDDEMVRNLAHQILAKCGYRVLEAASRKDALLICEQYPEEIQLLLTNVVMPEMSGRDMANQLLSRHTEMSVLYMSGYMDNLIVHHGLPDEEPNFIEKPFSPDVLAVKVRQVLDARDTDSS